MMRFLTLLLPTMSLLSFILGCGGSAPTAPKEWQKAKLVSGKLDHPQALISDEKFVYFVTGGTAASKQEGTNNVMKMPIDGGEAVILFKGGETIPTANSIALDENYVYFAADGFRRVPKAGGEATVLSKTTDVWEIVVDRENIYWLPFIGEGSPPKPIFSMPKIGGETKVLTDPRQTDGLRLDDKFLYWTQTDGIYKIPKSGGGVEKIYSTPNGEISSNLKADAENFYFLQGISQRNLMRLAKTGGAPAQIAADIKRFWLGDDEVVFERGINFSDNAIFKMQKNGGNEAELDRNGFLSDLTVGKNKIYLCDISGIFELSK